MSAQLTLSPTRPCSKKTQLIAQNLKLTDTEATKFWPIYDLDRRVSLMIELQLASQVPLVQAQ